MGLQTKTRQAGFLALVLMVLGSGIGRAEEAKRRFDIPAGNAVERLNALFAELGLSIICDYTATGVSNTNAVHGVFTLKEALEHMVQGQDIQFWFVSEKAVSCGRKDAKPKEATVVGLQTKRPSIEAPLEPAPLTEVTVTGTHIRGKSPIGVQEISFSRADIDRSGLATVQDFIRTLPQNFNGGPTEDTQRIGRETLTNSTRGTALNIRGLGPGETLVLLNGRRIATGGSEGAFVDIANIPLSAVERIDVLPDSGSALYGTDAIGGIVNITLKQDYQGAETQIRIGTPSDRVLTEYQLSQTLGRRWIGGNGLMSFEYYRRGELRAQSRRQAQSDLTSFGGDNFDTFRSNPGTLFAGGQLWAIPKDQDGTGLTPADFAAGTRNLENQQLGADVLPIQERWSLLASGHHTLSDDVDIFSDAILTERNMDLRSPAVRTDLPVTIANPFYVNPTGSPEPVSVSYSFLKDFGPLTSDVKLRTSNGGIGARIGLGATWRLVPYVSYAREEQRLSQGGQIDFPALALALLDPNPVTAFNPFGEGSNTNPATLAALRSQSSFDSNSDVGTVEVTADGPLLQLPAGEVKIAFGLSQRREAFDSILRLGTRAPLSNDRLSRDARALFGELLVPLADSNTHRGLRHLDLSLALRLEDYTEVGRATAPKFGVLWSPADGMTLRGTWTESFRAPNLFDLYEGNNGSIILPMLDDTAPLGFTQALVWFGRNADLRPESAKSWTLGVDFASRRTQDWSIAITYFDIQIENGFEERTFADNLLQDPRFVSFVTRNPTAGQRETVCERSAFGGLPDSCLDAPIDALIDLRLGNNALMSTNGLDLIARRSFDKAWGRVELGINGTYVLRYAEAETAQSPRIDLVDTQNNPLRLRARGSLSWQRGNLSANAFVNHDGAYRDIGSVPHREVSSWTTFDLQVRYDYTPGIHLFLSGQNVLNQPPPFLNNPLGFGYDAENADLLGRFLSVQVRKNW
jgi:outer membrane receptor protein involved in Fe transport